MAADLVGGGGDGDVGGGDATLSASRSKATLGIPSLFPREGGEGGEGVEDGAGELGDLGAVGGGGVPSTFRFVPTSPVTSIVKVCCTWGGGVDGIADGDCDDDYDSMPMTVITIVMVMGSKNI